MNIALTLITAFVTGALTKIVDLHHDNNLKLPYNLNMILGGFYGFLIALLISFVPEVAPLWIGGIIGVVALRKIDAEGHYVGLASTLFFVSLFGIPELNTFFLAAFTIFSCFDEFFASKQGESLVKNKHLKKILSLRPFLEVSALIISVFTGVWVIWLSILLFDIAYILADRFGQKHVKIEWVEI
ncbi:hypothetical protein D6745_01245 [Candidatus Woesearchaeota archaeon]|nr:MAG: hypothetical protein D6745_01245 [Candidatus Woesearchaeota archaeon]